MSTANKLLGGRYQFIQVLGTNKAGKTLLVADVHFPGHPKCVLQQIQLPTRNPLTLKFMLSLLKRKVEVLETIGRHKQIPATLSAFEVDQSFYLVQEFIPGHPLDRALSSGQPMSETVVLSLLKEILAAVAFAQDHGVVHGTLKPSKIIRHQSEGQLVLLDFGLLKSFSQEMSGREMSQFRARPAATSRVYLAPELSHSQPGFCSDHFAIGMIALQALTGLPPEELPDAKHPNLVHEVNGLLQHIPGLSANTVTLLARMVHPDPDHRYQKAVEILADLDLAQQPQSITVSVASKASPPSSEPAPTDISPASTGKMPRQLLAGAGLTLLVVLGSVMTLRVPQRFLATQQLRQGHAAEQNNQPEAAIAHYTRALDHYPNHATALVDRSQLYFQQGNTEAALSDITRAIETAPNNSTFAYSRGNFRLAVGDPQGAIEDYTIAIQQRPNFIKALVNRGSARADWGDDVGAVEDYTQALSLNPSPEVQAAAYLNRCLSRSNLGHHVLALEDCSAAISLRPSHGLAYQNRGLVRRRLGDLQGALQDYNIAIQIEPDSPDPYYNRGLTRQGMADLPGAIVDFSRALAIAPDYVFALYDRGLLHQEMGNPSEALADFRNAAQVCLDLGRTGCYDDAQYQITQLQEALPSTPPEVFRE